MVSVKHLDAYQVYDRILSYLWIGPEMFGFTNPDIIAAIEDLQGADECCGYIPYYERSMKVYYKDWVNYWIEENTSRRWREWWWWFWWFLYFFYFW